MKRKALEEESKELQINQDKIFEFKMGPTDMKSNDKDEVNSQNDSFNYSNQENDI